MNLEIPQGCVLANESLYEKMKTSLKRVPLTGEDELILIFWRDVVFERLNMGRLLYSHGMTLMLENNFYPYPFNFERYPAKLKLISLSIDDTQTEKVIEIGSEDRLLEILKTSKKINSFEFVNWMLGEKTIDWSQVKLKECNEKKSTLPPL